MAVINILHKVVEQVERLTIEFEEYELEIMGVQRENGRMIFVGCEEFNEFEYLTTIEDDEGMPLEQLLEEMDQERLEASLSYFISMCLEENGDFDDYDVPLNQQWTKEFSLAKDFSVDELLSEETITDRFVDFMEEHDVNDKEAFIGFLTNENARALAMMGFFLNQGDDIDLDLVEDHIYSLCEFVDYFMNEVYSYPTDDFDYIIDVWGKLPFVFEVAYSRVFGDEAKDYEHFCGTFDELYDDLQATEDAESGPIN